MASKTNKIIEKVDKENKRLSAEEVWQEEYWQEQKERYAENTRISVAKDEGEQIGIKKGEQIGKKEEQIKIAKKMKKENVKIEDIIKYTGLSKEEIEGINMYK